MSDIEERASFQVAIEHLDGSATIRLSGALDAAAAPTMREEMWPLLARYEAEMVTLEADGLRSADDEGVAVLISFAKAMAPGRPTVRGLRPHLRALLDDGDCFLFD